MNAMHTPVTLAPRTPVNVPSRVESASSQIQASRYRARDFGIGYGASSGVRACLQSPHTPRCVTAARQPPRVAK